MLSTNGITFVTLTLMLLLLGPGCSRKEPPQTVMVVGEGFTETWNGVTSFGVDLDGSLMVSGVTKDGGEFKARYHKYLRATVVDSPKPRTEEAGD